MLNQIKGRWQQRNRVLLQQVLKNQEVLMSQVDDVVSAVTKLGTDVGKEIADAQAALTVAIAAEADPTQAAKLTAVLGNLSTIDAAVTGFDTTLGTATGTATGS